MDMHFFFPYATVLTDAIPPSLCDIIIKRFEEDVTSQARTYYLNQRDFTEINISDPGLPWINFHNGMVYIMQQCIERYKTRFEISRRQWPKDYGFEQFRIKRYLPGTNEQFYFHTDVGDHMSARRFLACLWYLNTVKEGGETIFKFREDDPPIIKVSPQQGSVLMFPPTWSYPHAGLPTISGPKYIISGYCHYL